MLTTIKVDAQTAKLVEAAKKEDAKRKQTADKGI